VFILPNKKQLGFRVRSRKIKPRPPASGDGVLVGSQGRRSTMERDVDEKCNNMGGGGVILKRELQNKKEQETVTYATC
jgi:hypothetical protein